MRKVIIIVGATGLIGSALARQLASDCEIHCISRSAPTYEGVTWHEADLSQPLNIATLPKRADAVVYLAQSEHFRDFPDHSADMFQVNTVSLLGMLEYARRAQVGTFVYGSSGGVYGGSSARLNEEAQIPAHGDIGFYLSTKLCSEIIAQNYVGLFNVVILRYFFVYGPGQREDMLIPRLVNRVRAGDAIRLNGPEGITINPVHVLDAAAATRHALNLSSSSTINVAGPQMLSLRQIGDLVGRAVGREPVFATSESGGSSNLAGDITRMRQLLVAPQISFAEGLKSIL